MAGPTDEGSEPADGALSRRPWRRMFGRSPGDGGERTGIDWALEQRVEALRRDRQDLRRILASLGEGVLAVDQAGVVLHANPAARTLLDLDPATCIGSHLFIAVPHPAVCDALEDVMRGDRVDGTSRELTIDRPEGERVLVVDVTPLRDGDGVDPAPELGSDPADPHAIQATGSGAIAVVRDITGLRRLERARQDFFANVSHELKTPITAIRGALETIVDDPEMPGETRSRFLTAAVRHAARLGALVTDLLALARIEGDHDALQRLPLDLGVLVGEVLHSAESGAARRGVSLHLYPSGAADGSATVEWVVDGDEEALRQAVSNLVDNAVAHSEDGAVVRVSLHELPGAVELAVRDDGSGIPADALERVFERFYRVDAARSRARGGTGIGLSIVKHVAQAHGGAVAVTSTEGAGSTFRLRLPVSRATETGTVEDG